MGAKFDPAEEFRLALARIRKNTATDALVAVRRLAPVFAGLTYEECERHSEREMQFLSDLEDAIKDLGAENERANLRSIRALELKAARARKLRAIEEEARRIATDPFYALGRQVRSIQSSLTSMARSFREGFGDGRD